jgi:N-acetylmuramoyl-L-alanine amidase
MNTKHLRPVSAAAAFVSFLAASIFITTFTSSTAAAGAGGSSAVNSPPVRVMIDPGHGGEDDGAVVKGVREKDVTLKVGLELKKLLSRDSKFHAMITRDHDRYVPLNERSQMAVDDKADVFVSIHCNSSTEPKAHGTEFYFENQVPTDEESMQLAAKENNVKPENSGGATASESDVNNILSDLVHNEHLFMSQQLAQNLLESFQKEFNVRTRAIRQAPFRVLLVTMPATLVELGFITNPAEEKWLTDPDVQKQMARSLYQGLKHFKEKLDKARNTTVK